MRSNGPLGNRLVEASKYPASLAPWIIEVLLKPWDGTWDRAAARIELSASLNGGVSSCS